MWTQSTASIAPRKVFVTQFRQIQSEYPIVFRKIADTDGFEPVALFGLSENENLFLSDKGWNASYIPLTMERQPFLIGFQNSTVNGVSTEEPVVYVDMDSPRVSQTEGEAVFLQHGGSSPYLEHINSVLLSIHEGHEDNKAFSQALAKLELLEPFVLEVTLRNQSKQKLSGFYTINEKALQQLQGDALVALHSKGYLEQTYMAIASVTNMRTLIKLKNSRL